MFRKDTINPSISFNPSSSSWSDSVSVDVDVSDSGGSNLNRYRYKWTQTTTKPSSGWSSWDGSLAANSDSFSETKHSDGEWYLHVQVEDIAEIVNGVMEDCIK